MDKQPHSTSKTFDEDQVADFKNQLMSTKLIVLAVPFLTALAISAKLWWKPRHPSASSKILVGYFIQYTLLLSSILLVTSQITGAIEPLINGMALLFYCILLAIPPTMYLYVCSLQEQNNPTQQSSQKLTRYFYPALLLVLLNSFSYIYLYLMSETSFAFEVIEYVMSFANAIALLLAFPVLSIYYIYRSYGVYKAHQKRAANVYSYTEKVDLNWMKAFISGYVLLIGCIYLAEAQGTDYMYLIFSVLLGLYFAYIGYKGDHQEVVFTSETQVLEAIPYTKTINTTMENIAIAKKEVPKESLLTKEVIQALKRDLQELMETEKPYLDSKLTVYQLAKQAKTNSKYLSYVLNNEYQKNFVSYINDFRIKEAQRLLLDPLFNNYTIEAIGEMAGFNSKSTFNMAFKKYTNSTPSKFRKNNI